MSILLSGTFEGKMVPYQRQTRRQRNKRYEASKAALAIHMLSQARGRKGKPVKWSIPVIQVPFCFRLVVTIPPTKKGKFPKNAGDLDNFVKAWLDAAQKGLVIENDNPAWFRSIEARFVRGEAWSFEWAFLEVEL